MVALDCNHPNIAIEKRLERIYALHTKKMDFRLDKGPYIDLLANLGNPHLNCPPIIHIAGTNGKGSTLAFLKSICEEAGLSIHAYTSPHLIKFNERITLNGRHIDDDQLIEYLNLIDKTNSGAPLTFFEYTTALAFKAFADHPADIVLLETGLGGRLDCTNVIENPLATIITAIGYDHMDWLGSDIAAIAGEKAGIMKAGSPCFIAPQNHDVRDVLKQKSEIVGCDIHFVKRMDNLSELGLVGDHQRDNASVAVHAIQSVRKDISQNIIDRGLGKTQWPARMEKLSDTPDIWFDCGHNVDGAKTIAAKMKIWKTENPNRQIHLVLGLAADKDPNAFLSPILDYCDSITCVDLLNARNPQYAHDLKDKIEVDVNVSLSSTAHIKDAIRDKDDKTAITFICGSLYLYGEVEKI